MMTRPMTLAYLTSVYARASDTFIRGEVAELRALGHTVHTYSIRRPAATEWISDDVRRERTTTDDIVAAGPLRLAWSAVCELVRAPRRFFAAAKLARRFGVPGLRGRLWPFAYLLEAAYLARRLRAKGVEHLHNHIGENSAAVAALAAALAGIPFSNTVHGPNEFDRPTLLALGEKVRQSAFTVAVSEFGRSQLYRWCDHADWSKVHVVRCGLDRAFLEAEPVAIPEDPALVCVGRLSEQKGQLLLLEAAALLAVDGVAFRLTIIGDGPMRQPIARLIERRKLEHHVELAGWQAADDVRDAVLRSRVLVLASFAEGLPVVLMEALALRRPVVATAVAGIPELVESGEDGCGWLVPPGSVVALADALRKVVKAPRNALERMGERGARRVALLHDARAEAAKLAGLFDRACRQDAGIPASAARERPRTEHAATVRSF